MRRLLRLLRGLLVTTALVVVLVVGGVLAFEAGGGLERSLQAELDRIVAAEPDLELTFRTAEVDWLTPAVTVRGLHLVGGDGGELLLESVALYLDLSPDAPRLVHGLEVGRGRLVIEQGFTEAVLRTVARLGAEVEARPKPAEERLATLPIVGLDGLEVALRVGPDELFELGQGAGRLELVDGDLTVTGAVAVPQGDSGKRPLFVEAVQEPSGRATVRVAARNLDLASRGSGLRRLLPPGLRGLDVATRASVDLTATLVDGLPVETSANLRLERGYLRAGEALPALEELTLEGDLTWTDPGPELEPWRGLSGHGRFTAGVLGETLVGDAELGLDGRLGLSLANDDLALGEDLLEAAGLGPDHPARQSVVALGLGGRADVDLGLALDLSRDLTAPGALLEALDLAAEVRSDGGGTFCFNGYEVRGPRQGFPLRVDGLEAQVVIGLAGRNRRDALVGLVDVSATHGTGPARCRGLIATPLVPRDEPDLDLVIEVEGRAFDEDLRLALDGMHGTDTLWDEFNPAGGEADATVRLRSREDEGGILARLELTARDAPMRWRGLPVDLVVDELDLWMRWSGDVVRDERDVPIRAGGAVWKARGRSASVEDLAVTGLSRERDPLARELDPAATPLHHVEVTGSGLALRGADWDGLTRVAPGLEAVTDELGAKGRARFRWTDRGVRSGGLREVDLEAVPEELQLLPAALPVVLRDVAGRVTLSDDGEAAPRLGATLGAAWAAGPRVAATVAVDLPRDTMGAEDAAPAVDDPPDDDAADATDPGPDPPAVDALAGTVALVAPGVDPTSEALRGALGVLGEGEPSPLAGDAAPRLAGRLDLSGRLVAGGAPATPPTVELDIVLRGNAFRSGPLELTDLEGRLVLEGGRLRGERVGARLAGSPVELLEPRVVLPGTPAAAAGEPLFRTLLDAEDLPLDRAHLAAFLEPEALDALVDDFDWTGQVDLERVDLRLDARPDAGLRVALAGRLVPSAMRLVLGIPIEVARAQVDLEELVLEAGRARAWGRTSGLFGSLAGRELRDAGLLFSYVDQRLTIEDLDAAFAGGQLTSPGGEGGLALAVDLAPPHNVSLGTELTGVRAEELLAGAFGGGANRGVIDASLRFEGRPGDLLAATGAGWLRVRDARLFSIPVFRELFTSLGFDATAVFDSMRTTFSLQDGVVELRELRARSPLLRLEGAGTWDLDGRLDADLEVRYSLIEKLGPLRVFVNWFQDSILRVSVRGDVYRPVVLLRNSLLELFGERADPGPRLPLPPLGPPRN